jgi:hypothetical protein
MKLSLDEEAFLRQWMYDETHYREGAGPAKRLQVEHGVRPADLAALIAAAIPDVADQEAAGAGTPPAEPLRWPWSVEVFHRRLNEARVVLQGRASGKNSSRSDP